MLLSSLGRASFEGILAVSSSSTRRALHTVQTSQRVWNAHAVRATSLSKIFGNILKSPYVTNASKASKIKSKSQKLSSQSPRKNVTVSAPRRSTNSSMPLKKKRTTVKKVVKKLAKKPGKKSKKLKKPKKSKKSKKPLTAEQKRSQKLRLLRLKALKIPKRLPFSARTVYMAERLKGQNRDSIKSMLASASSSWKNIDSSHKEEYEKKAAINRATNEKNINEWRSQYTPDQIRIANNARRQIVKAMPRFRKSFKQISDPRFPKNPPTLFSCYLKDRFDAIDTKGINVVEFTKKIAKEFHDLTENERKKYADKSLHHRELYKKEYKKVFHHEPEAPRKAVN